MTASDSLCHWLVQEIREVLQDRHGGPPLLVWCDPDREWVQLLRVAAQAGGFELWAPEAGEPEPHELLVRERFYTTPRAARVVWLPCARDHITWFKPFELEAQSVWEKSLLQALRDYGVHIPREQEAELLSLLPAHAREWLDKPRDTWKELTPGNVKGALVDDHRMLQVLAGPAGEFDQLRTEERFDIFARRATEDFGLPDPSGQDEEAWRVAATARLLCTEAAAGCPQDPPREGDRVIPPGLARKRSLDLLQAWQHHVQHIPQFERLVPRADATVGLTYWARNLSAPPRSRASRAVEETLFQQTVDRLDRIEEVDLLVQELNARLQAYKERESGFWGKQAFRKVGWSFLVQLSNAASLLAENARVEEGWQSVPDAVSWYRDRGWQLDQAGEDLFKEAPDLPPTLHRVRARLRRGYLRATDRIGRVFSELLDAHSARVVSLPTAGEVALAELDRSKAPTALVFLDACRLELGQRLAELLNHGEPAQRATVTIAVAPVPSITALGMAFALPLRREQLHVAVSPDGKTFRVTADGFDGDLHLAEARRQWLSRFLDVKDFLKVEEVLDGEKLKRPGKSRRLVVVHGDEFDRHDGELQLTGAGEHLKRYVQAIHRLRDAGYSRVIVVTDHGFFHWQPEEHEIEEDKPSGEVLWTSRRAIVGRNLSHPHAVRLPVPRADLDVMVPRSVNSFKTYGALGFFHGGATLQELIIPVLVASWPAKARKVDVVLKPVTYITSEAPRVQVDAGATGQRLMFAADVNLLARRVLVKVYDRAGSKLVFRHPEPVTVEPGGEVITVQLSLVDPRPELPFGTPLVVQVLDADDEEVLVREDVILKVDINEW